MELSTQWFFKGKSGPIPWKEEYDFDNGVQKVNTFVTEVCGRSDLLWQHEINLNFEVQQVSAKSLAFGKVHKQ